MFPEGLAKLKEELSEADKMFEDLDLLIDENEERIVVYKTNCTGVKIYICVFYNTEDPRFRLKLYEQYCRIELLQAISKKMEELYCIDTK